MPLPEEQLLVISTKVGLLAAHLHSWTHVWSSSWAGMPGAGLWPARGSPGSEPGSVCQDMQGSCGCGLKGTLFL